MFQQCDYSQIPIGAVQALAGEKSADFTVYLPGQSRHNSPVLYREAGADLSGPDFDRLARHGVSSLYVRTADLARCEAILEAKLGAVLHSSDISADEKADVVYHVGTALARDLTHEPDPAPGLERASHIVDNVIACILSDPLIAANMLHMVGHERTMASHMFIVSALAVMLGAEVYGPSHEMLKALGFAGMMHDIGKLGINPELLNKQTPLTPSETQMIQQHPIESVRLLGGHPEVTPQVRRMILQHHERIDGRGYPLGVKGDDFATGSRILSIVDSFHAMIGRRGYRTPLTPPEANRAMQPQADRQFDADLLACWNELFERSWSGGSQGGPVDITGTRDEVSSRHEHRPTSPPPKVFGYRQKRYECSENVTVNCVYAGRLVNVGTAPDSFVAPVRDVSQSGLCIYSAHPMYRGEVVHVRINDGKQHLWVRGTVAWCRQHDAHVYKTGVRLEQRISDQEAHEEETVRGMADLDTSARNRVRAAADGTVSAAPRLRDVDTATSKQESALATLSAIAAMRKVPVEAERTVIALSTSADAQVRLAAVDVLMTIGTKAARSALAELLDDSESQIRERAVLAAGALHMTEAAYNLRRLLNNASATVALRAAGALGRLGDDSGLPLVAGTLMGNGPHTRLAAHVLGEIVGHRFAANAEGVKAARRYLSAKKLAAAS